MSRIFFFRALLVVFLCSLAASQVLAQVKNPALDNPKYGADPATREECLRILHFIPNITSKTITKTQRRGGLLLILSVHSLPRIFTYAVSEC